MHLSKPSHPSRRTKMQEPKSNVLSMRYEIDLRKSSSVELLARATDQELDAALATMSLEQCQAFPYDWEFWSRPSQRAPEDPDWLSWLLLSGRGFGKTRAGAEWIRQQAKAGVSPLALI